jgi:hypothetical protein
MPDDLSWNFDRVFEFSKAFDEDAYLEDDGLLCKSSLAKPERQHGVPRSLGDFSRIYQALGISPLTLVSYWTLWDGIVDADCKQQAKPKPLESPPELVGDRPSSPSSLSEPAEDFDDFVNGSLPKGVRWPDEPRPDNNNNYFSPLNVFQNDGLLAVEITPGKSISKPSIPTFGLVPASVLVPSSLAPKKVISSLPYEHDIDPLVIRPLKPVTSPEQKSHLVKRLRRRYKESPSLFESDFESAIYSFGVIDSHGVHVFVDFSNIIIGFCNKIKATRGLHEKAFVSLLSIRTIV